MEACICLNENKKGNCNFVSHNSDFFFSQLRVYISQFRLFFISELCDINLQLGVTKSEL